MTIISQCKFTTTILNSGIKAFEDHYEMTNGGCWLYYTPEYWYTVAMAKALNKIPNYNVSIETAVGEVRKHANRGKIGAPSKAYRSGGRADIVIWKNDIEPRAIVEIKKGWSWDKKLFGPDLNRLTASLLDTGKKSKTGTIKHGFFVVVTDADGETRQDAKTHIINLRNTLKTKIKSYMEDKGKFECESRFRIGNSESPDEPTPGILVFRISKV